MVVQAIYNSCMLRRWFDSFVLGGQIPIFSLTSISVVDFDFKLIETDNKGKVNSKLILNWKNVITHYSFLTEYNCHWLCNTRVWVCVNVEEGTTYALVLGAGWWAGGHHIPPGDNMQESPEPCQTSYDSSYCLVVPTHLLVDSLTHTHTHTTVIYPSKISQIWTIHK